MKIILVIILLSFTLVTYGKEFNFSGKIVDQDNTPFAGASLMINGELQTFSNAQGEYEVLNFNSDLDYVTVTAEFIGYKSHKVVIHLINETNFLVDDIVLVDVSTLSASEACETDLDLEKFSPSAYAKLVQKENDKFFNFNCYLARVGKIKKHKRISSSQMTKLVEVIKKEFHKFLIEEEIGNICVLETIKKRDLKLEKYQFNGKTYQYLLKTSPLVSCSGNMLRLYASIYLDYKLNTIPNVEIIELE